MIAISTTELHKNLRKYLDMATREKVVRLKKFCLNSRSIQPQVQVKLND